MVSHTTMIFTMAHADKFLGGSRQDISMYFIYWHNFWSMQYSLELWRKFRIYLVHHSLLQNLLYHIKSTFHPFYRVMDLLMKKLKWQLISIAIFVIWLIKVVIGRTKMVMYLTWVSSACIPSSRLISGTKHVVTDVVIFIHVHAFFSRNDWNLKFIKWNC